MMGTKTRVHVLMAGAALAGAIGLGVLAASPAFAYPCTDQVVDYARVINSDTAAVKAAATDLQSAVGADVRVLTVQNLGGEPTLDSLVANWCRECASLSAPGGGIKTNLIVFAMSLDDRTVGIFYGDTWKPAFTGANTETRIWQDFMVPRFQNGEYAQGFIDAIKETQRVLTIYLHPGQADAGNRALAGWIALGVLGAAGGGLGTRQIVKTVLTKRAAEKEAEAKRQAARKALADARTAVMDGLLELDARKADVDVAAVYEAVSDEMAPARAAYADATAEANKDILGDTTNERDDLTTAQYQEAQKSYDAALPQVEKARQAVADISRIEDDIKQAMANLPKTFKDEAKSNKDAQALLADMSAGGIKIPADIQAGVDSLDGDLGAAQAAMSSMAVVLPALAALRKKRDDAINGAKAIKAQADEFASELSQLTGEVDGLDLPACQGLLTQIQDGYDEACWQGAPEAFAAAKDARARAEKSLAAAQATGKTQDWPAAAKVAEDGFSAVNDFNVQAGRLDDILKSLTDAPGHLKTVQASAKSAIDAAWEYARANTDDDVAHEEEITKAESTLAASIVSGSKPDWLAGIALAEAAETIAHQALASCQSEVAQAERARIEERQRKQHDAAVQAKLRQLQDELAAQADSDYRSSFWGSISSGDSSGSSYHASSSFSPSVGASISSGGGFHGSSGSFSSGGGFHGSSGHW